MNVQVLPDTLAFDGILDEKCSLDNLVQAFSDLKQSGFESPIKIDLSKVRRANSSGIILWLKFLQKIGTTVTYINSPVWLVNQFNMIDQFFENSSNVKSLLAPFYCEDTDTSLYISLNIGQEVPIQDSYDDFLIENKVVDGNEYEPDFEPERFFSFLSGIKNNY